MHSWSPSWCCWVVSRFTVKFVAEIFSFCSAPAFEWILGVRCLFLTILLYLLRLGIWIHHLFMSSTLLSRWFFEDKFLKHPTFPNLPNLISECLLSKFHRDQLTAKNNTKEYHRDQLTAKNNTKEYHFPNWQILVWSLAEIGWHSTIAPEGIIGPLNGSPNRLSFGIFPSARRSWKLCR